MYIANKSKHSLEDSRICQSCYLKVSDKALKWRLQETRELCLSQTKAVHTPARQVEMELVIESSFWQLGVKQCFESSPKIQEEKLKVQTVPPCPSAVPCDPTWEPMTF